MALSLSQLETRVNEVFYIIITCQMTSKAGTDLVIERITKPITEKTASGRRKHSVFMEGYAAGLVAAWRSRIWQEHVEFCYLYDGVLYSTHKKTNKRSTEEFYSKGLGHLLNDCPHGHYWKNSNKEY